MADPVVWAPPPSGLRGGAHADGVADAEGVGKWALLRG